MKVHIVMNGRTIPYFNHCIKNHLLLADHPEQIEFGAYALDDEGVVRAGNQEDLGITASFLEVTALKHGAGSVGHMIGLNAIFANLKKNDINVISDSDCVVLMKGWDTKLKELIAGGLGCIGTTYEDVGGFSSGAGTFQTYKRVPNFSWIALSPKYSWKFDTSEDKANPLPITTQEQSEAFNLPIGYTLFREPCWQFPLYLYQNNITYGSLEFVRPTSSKAKAVLSGEDYHTEYTLADGTPFVAHQRGSMKQLFRVDHLSKTFYDACDAYIASQLGK